MSRQKALRRLKIHRGIRKKISGTSERPRISIFRSNRKIYAQLIDDVQGHTLAAYSSKELNAKNSTVTLAKEVGLKLATLAVENGIKDVVFDRSGYLYHGQVKALAEGAREGGLNF